MRVIEIKHIEDCVDGSNIREYVLDEKITKGLVDRLSLLAENVQYFGCLDQPFFKIETPRQFTIKGLVDNLTLRVTLRGCDKVGVEAELLAAVSGGQ